MTDAQTRPGLPGASFTTPSAAHQLAWNTTSTLFWIRSVDGTIIPFSFDPITMTAARIQASGSGDGGLTIASQVEPQFSFLSGNILYSSTQDPVDDWPVVRQFDFATLTYTNVLNLGAVATIAHGTYAGALSSTAQPPETLSIIFGGQQDSHYKVAVFNPAAPLASAVVLDTLTSTITRNGTAAPTNVALGFHLHHAWIDPSGRFVVLEPVDASPAPFVVWDLDTDVLTLVTTRGGGHYALGYHRLINQACCAQSSYDGAQWQLRDLAAPNATTDVINPVLTPQEVFVADHTSWNNAQPSTAVPILASLYRYSDGMLNNTPWRAWDNEIVAIQTGGGAAGATVWRFAHHRSNVAYEDPGPDVYFWYLPRAVISPNGKWAIFTSNWEKTLGNSATPEPGGQFRCDVFLIALAKGGIGNFTDDPLVPRETLMKTIHILELRSRTDALRTRFGLPAFAWTDPDLAAGTFVKAAHLLDLRAALQGAYLAAGRAAPAFTDATPTAGVTVIKVVHIQELRDAVIDLETQ